VSTTHTSFFSILFLPIKEKSKREPSGALQFEEGRSSTNLSSIVSNDQVCFHIILFGVLGIAQLVIGFIALL